MAMMAYRDALNLALKEEMRRDDRVFLMGEEVGAYQGAYRVSKGLLQEFGPRRVIDTPIAEAGFVGAGVGAAMVGLRPVVEVMTFNFAVAAMDSIVNSAAKVRYMSGGQVSVPMVIRGPGGSARQLAAQHSQALEAWFCHVPGLKVCAPSTPRDARGLLKSAIRDDNPVLVIESELLYGATGEVPEAEEVIPLGVAEVVRAGRDATVIAYSKMVREALAAAKALAGEGVDVEVIDPRTLRPFDWETVLASVRKTKRAVVVQEGWTFCGVAAEIAATISAEAFDDLDAPVERVTSLDVPLPYARPLEAATVPEAGKIAAAVKRALYLV
ncbi:MAG: pyruvate dehydrogenase complex E1 component subunit beta [Nitrospirae bacterium]|nr:pyruvate dehydrogenase complex E1 component subunit beta [Nitrospirota bacterium]